jgi:hypothetical protein
MRQNLLTAAALDGARAASFPDTDSVNTVIASVEDRLTRGGIDPELVDIAINPTSLGSLNTGDSMIVTLSCPISDMMWVGPIMPPETNLSAQISCERE